MVDIRASWCCPEVALVVLTCNRSASASTRRGGGARERGSGSTRGSSQAAHSEAGRISGIRSWISRSGPTESVVMMVIDTTASPSAGRQYSQSPAKAITEPSCGVMKYGCLTAFGFARRVAPPAAPDAWPSGYYEWKLLGHASGAAGGAARRAKPKAVKQPYFMTPQDGSVMAFAGLWEYWRPAEGDAVVSMTIITTDSVGPLREIHDRMPLILPASEWAAWLDPRVEPEPRSRAPPPRRVLALAERLHVNTTSATSGQHQLALVSAT